MHLKNLAVLRNILVTLKRISYLLKNQHFIMLLSYPEHPTTPVLTQKIVYETQEDGKPQRPHWA